MKKLLLTSCLALGLASGLFADTLSVSSVNGGAATGSNKLNLDSLLLGAGTQAADGTVTITGHTGDAQIVNGSVVNTYAAPFISGGNGVAGTYGTCEFQ